MTGQGRHVTMERVISYGSHVVLFELRLPITRIVPAHG